MSDNWVRYGNAFDASLSPHQRAHWNRQDAVS